MKRITSGPGYGRFMLATVFLLLMHAMNIPVAAAASQWLPITGDGLNGPVSAIAKLGTDVYVGGRFTATKDGSVQNLNGIALYRNGAWSPLTGGGLSTNNAEGAEIKALMVFGNDLYVGGYFNETADGAVTGLNNIARYSNGEWFPLANNGVDGPVYAFEVHGQDLYVAGNFSGTADRFLSYFGGIAKYSAGAWSELPNDGLLGPVRALKWWRGDLYVGGSFDKTVDRQIAGLNHIAKLENGKVWKPVGNGLNNFVTSFETFNNQLVIGGYFTAINNAVDGNLGYIVSWDGNKYRRLQNNGMDSYVWSLLARDGVLYVGGWFRATSDGRVKDLHNIAKFNGNSWSAMPNKGLAYRVETLGNGGGSLLVGGNFDGTWDGQIKDFSNFAEFDLGANLKLTQTVQNGSFDREFIAVLQVVNRGPNIARNVQVSNTVPGDYVATNATTDKGTCDLLDEAKVLCKVDSLGSEAAMNIRVTLRAKGSVPFVVKNCAQAKSETYDPNPVNDKACARVPPQ